MGDISSSGHAPVGDISSSGHVPVGENQLYWMCTVGERQQQWLCCGGRTSAAVAMWRWVNVSSGDQEHVSAVHVYSTHSNVHMYSYIRMPILIFVSMKVLKLNSWCRCGVARTLLAARVYWHFSQRCLWSLVRLLVGVQLALSHRLCTGVWFAAEATACVFAANSITHVGQQVLLYIVPATLLTVLATAASRSEVGRV